MAFLNYVVTYVIFIALLFSVLIYTLGNLQTGQFVCMRESVGGRYNSQNVYNMSPTQEHYDIVDWALAGGRLIGVDGSLFFHNPYSPTCPTYFPTNVGVIHNRVGDHCFYLPTSYYANT